jgi:hypothetical protein
VSSPLLLTVHLKQGAAYDQPEIIYSLRKFSKHIGFYDPAAKPHQRRPHPLALKRPAPKTLVLNFAPSHFALYLSFEIVTF